MVTTYTVKRGTKYHGKYYAPGSSITLNENEVDSQAHENIKTRVFVKNAMQLIEPQSKDKK